MPGNSVGSSKEKIVVEPSGTKLNLCQRNWEVRVEGESWAAATECATTLGQPNLMCLTWMFWWWEETGTPGENPHRHGETMQTPHRKILPQLGIWPRTFLLRQCYPRVHRAAQLLLNYNNAFKPTYRLRDYLWFDGTWASMAAAERAWGDNKAFHSQLCLKFSCSPCELVMVVKSVTPIARDVARHKARRGHRPL